MGVSIEQPIEMQRILNTLRESCVGGSSLRFSLPGSELDKQVAQVDARFGELKSKDKYGRIPGAHGTVYDWGGTWDMLLYICVQIT